MPCLFYDFEPGERVVLRERDHDRVYGNVMCEERCLLLVGHRGRIEP